MSNDNNPMETLTQSGFEKMVKTQFKNPILDRDMTVFDYGQGIIDGIKEYKEVLDETHSKTEATEAAAGKISKDIAFSMNNEQLTVHR